MEAEYIAILGGVILIAGMLIGFLYKIYRDKANEEQYQKLADSDLTDPIADLVKRANERKKAGS